jgi:hypothetical protein
MCISLVRDKQTGTARLGIDLCQGADWQPPLNEGKLRNVPDTMWNPIADAPFETDLEIGVIDAEGVHALVFACRRTQEGWVESVTGKPVEVKPTHWRRWTGELNRFLSPR